MRRPLISDQWAREYHSDESSGFRDGIMLTPLTFCGALEDLYRGIARHWNDATRKKYDRDYNNVILPHIENHNSRIISSYAIKDCENILLRIQEDGYDNKGMKTEYSESARNHYKYLIYSVFYYASLAGYCHDFLWGTKFEINVEREALAVRSKTLIKKSLSIEQEKKLISIIMESPKENTLNLTSSILAIVPMYFGLPEFVDPWAKFLRRTIPSPRYSGGEPPVSAAL